MNNASIILFIVGTVVLIFSFSLKMSNFLDVRSIFLEHFSVFKGNPLQLVSIFIVPVLFSIGILNIRCVDSEILNNLNITLSILIAMFFSTLSILCAFADKDNKNSKYKQLLKERWNLLLHWNLLFQVSEIFTFRFLPSSTLPFINFNATIKLTKSSQFGEEAS